MNRNLFIFLLVIILIYGVSISYLQDEPIYVLSVLVFVPVVAMIVSFLLSFCVKAYLVRGNYSASLPNKPTAFQIRLRNRAPISITKVECVLIASYLTSGKSEKIRVSATLTANETLDMRIPVAFKYCGLAQIRIKKIRIYDWLSLFRWSRKVNQKQSVVVLPEYTLMPIKNRNSIWHDITNSSRFHSTLVGEDPSEIVSFHSMQPGDKLQRVHWKLSAKSDDLMVKDFGMPLCSRVCLYVDMNYKTREEYSDRMTMALSVGLSLLDADCPFTLLWFQRQLEMHQVTVYEIDDLYEVFAEFLRNSDPIGTLPLPLVFSEAKLENRMRQFIVVTGPRSRGLEQDELLLAKRSVTDELIILSADTGLKSTEPAQEIIARDIQYTFASEDLMNQLSGVELVVM
ncbi:MAG: DUF58 domain-containing protein [Lachnospiraceae bacterium]|nr:DUF58 domain-containing protein [Lachnospiraceae bacterium]